MDGERSLCHVHSGQVMTVLGAVPASSLGPTLIHEHIFIENMGWWNKPITPERAHLGSDPVHPGILGELRMDPFANLDNCHLRDEDVAASELMLAVNEGARTLVDPTCRGIGRNPLGLLRISQATGLNIVMGSGYYLQTSHPACLRAMSAGDVSDEITREAVEGVGDTGIRIGLIGEIGVSSDFTPDEQTSLRGAARAQARTNLPLMIHLPAWYRHAHRVLDMVEEEGADLRHTILCHMGPSSTDPDYQIRAAARGAFISFDMIGMDYFYADQQVQCPSDDENARGILHLIRAGFRERLLVSQDVFMKIMLTRYGGFGYGYLQRHFLPRLARHGATPDDLHCLMVGNPRDVFHAVEAESVDVDGDSELAT